MTSISTYIQKYGTSDPTSELWLSLRALIGPELPEPHVHFSDLEGNLETLVWDTTCYEVRIEEPEAGSTQVAWEARAKRSGIRSSGRGNPISCPALALWLGRLCGENHLMHARDVHFEDESA